MAGLYHKIDLTLNTNEKVLRAAQMLEVDVDLVVGKLVRIWTFAHQQGLRFGDVSVYVLPEFAPNFFGFWTGSERKRKALASKWLRVFLNCGTSLGQGLLISGENSEVFINGWEEYMAADETRKSNNNRRKQLSRERQKQAAEPPGHTGRHAPVTGRSSSSSKAEHSNSNTTQRASVTLDDQKPEPEQTAKPQTPAEFDAQFGEPELWLLDMKPILAGEWKNVRNLQRLPIIGTELFDEPAELMAAWRSIWEDHGETGIRDMVRRFNEPLADRPYDGHYFTIKGFIKNGIEKASDALAPLETPSPPKPEKSPPTPVSEDCVRIWGAVVKLLRVKIGDEDFDTWFRDVYLSDKNGGACTISVPGPKSYRAERLDAYRIRIETAISSVAGHTCWITFEITGHVGEGEKE